MFLQHQTPIDLLVQQESLLIVLVIVLAHYLKKVIIHKIVT